MSKRLVGEIENARRESYNRSTLAALDRALKWEPGSAAAVLAGGEPTELDEPASAGGARLVVSSRQGAKDIASALEHVGVSVDVQGVGQVVPTAALDGLDELERDEVLAAARMAALAKAREIRATRPLPPEWALAARRVTDRPGHGAAHQWDAVGEESQEAPDL